eukprot:5121542-Pleurochrysis_carterae.AAC.1
MRVLFKFRCAQLGHGHSCCRPVPRTMVRPLTARPRANQARLLGPGATLTPSASTRSSTAQNTR